MTEDVESLTEESIKAAEMDYDELISKKGELSTLFTELVKLNAQIERINQDIHRRLPHPMKPGTLNIHTKEHGWTNYFEEARHYVHEKQKQEQLNEKLKALETEGAQIEEKIRALVPVNFYGIQLVLGNSSQRLTVNPENMQVIS